MKNMTLIRNLLLAAVMAAGMTESSVAATSWFNGGVNANWPTDATGGEWYCQNIASLKWTETFIPGVDTTVPGVTLDNWAYVGLKFTATQALGLSDDVTEATFSTTVLLAPVLKDEMPSVDSADKGGVLLVHEDDGSLRYYVVAQNDETNGTGANVWKLASSIPRVTVDAVPVVIGIRFYRDGERWLVDYTVDGVTEPSHVVSFGSASTIDSVRFTGPCTVQSLSATFESQSTPPVDPTDEPVDPTDEPVDPPEEPTDDPTDEPTQMFYIGEIGYDSFADAYSAAKDGDTIKVGKDANFAVSGGKAITIDLCGRSATWNAGGYAYTGAITLVDSGTPSGSGSLVLANGNQNTKTTVDLSALTASQISGTGRFYFGPDTKVIFPSDMLYDACMGRINFQQTTEGSKIVVQGVNYEWNGSAWISDSPVVTYSITITAPQNGTLETSVTNDVAAGTTVTVTATPATGYQLVSVTTNGAPITGTSFTMPAADVTLAATFEELPPTPPDEPTQMFYIGEIGYDSWADLMNVLRAGDIVKLGKDAEASGSPVSATFDLCGKTLTVSQGWWYNSYTVVDSSGDGSGRFKLGDLARNFSEGKLDLSALGKEQLEGGSLQINDAKSLVKFPGDMTLEECTKFISSKATGTQIVVQGVTYKWNGSIWVSDRVRIFDVDCELATDGTHAKFQIMIATNWLAEAFGEICPDGEVADANAEELIEERLNAADAVNGLNHVWMNYVLGAMLPGDEDGRIWIRADQTSDPSALRFRTQEFSPIQDCGFSVRFRLPEKTSADDHFVRGDTYSASSTFEASVASDTLTHRVIDMIFIPDGCNTSCEYVTTVNTAGVLKVVSDKKVNLLSAPWCGFSPTNNPAVKATDFVKAACLSENDLLYVYDNEHQNYIAWAVQPDGTWAAVKTYVIANGVAAESAADATQTNDIPRGTGFWLERKDPTKPIFLYGQVDASQVTTSLAPGFNLVANPYPTAFDASSLEAPVKGGEEGDRIVIPTGGAPINCTYDSDKGWGWFKDEVVEVVPGVSAVSPSWTTEGLTVPAGQGFWYLNSGTDAVELAWPTSAGGKDE